MTTSSIRSSQRERPRAPHADATELLARVRVGPPYLALRDVHTPRPGVCSAWLSPEQPLGAELGPIAAPEAGRHLAILGSLAAASLGSGAEAGYYLARAARLERACGPVLGRSRALQGVATAHRIGARDAVASTILRTSAGAAVYRLCTEYTVLAPRPFERAFRAARRKTPTPRYNPHGDPLVLSTTRLDELGAAASMRFEVGQCAGHFDGFPAVPVARLMQGLTTLAGLVLQRRRRSRNVRYFVRQADVRAQRLAFAGEVLALEASVVGERDDALALRCGATTRDGEVGEMHLWLVSPTAR